MHAAPHADEPPSTLAVVPPVVGLCSVTTATLDGLRPVPIDVEVSSRRGPAMFVMAGLAEASVREARVRVTSAIARLGITLEEYALTVNLAPADVRKSGSGLDLSVAVSILGAIGHLTTPPSPRALYLGELSLDGLVRPIRGVLPLLEGAKKLGFDTAFVPHGNGSEAGHCEGIETFVVPSLGALVEHCQGGSRLARARPSPPIERHDLHPDIADVRGQETAKRALLIAATGCHNVLLSGPPGAGKSLLARRLPGLLPELSIDDALETTSIHSVAGLVDPSVGLVRYPPFRAPHHTVSDSGLVGGGPSPRPGELSLAHNGVLFLDELPEFRRSSLEALRQPLEDGFVSIVRARSSVVFPAKTLVVGAMNPCPCGNYRNPKASCSCSPEARARYLARLSGPLLDRLDLLVHVPPVDLGELSSKPRGEDSASLRDRLVRARAFREARRGEDLRHGAFSSSDVLLEARLAPESSNFLRSAGEKLGLSARAYLRTLRVARTIADLEGAPEVGRPHLAEALALRSFEPGPGTDGLAGRRGVTAR